MRKAANRILTTHVGSLPGPADVWQKSDVPHGRLLEAVTEVVNRQKEIGIDLINEGELTKQGSWSMFMRRRMSGFEHVDVGKVPAALRREVSVSVDRQEFAEFYEAAARKGTLFEQTGTAHQGLEGVDRRPLLCTGPVTYTGQDPIREEIELLRSALGSTAPADAFLTTVAPASFETGIINAYYGTEAEYLEAIANALAVEYESIAAAGFVVQVDDAFVPALWETIGHTMGLPAYRSYVRKRLEMLNHALRNVPMERVRYHLCWGSWHGPHAHDLPLRDIVDLLLSVNAGAYLIESANVRHEHEWRVWQDVKLPEGRVLMPGVVSHATTLIEHPELVADRLIRLANILGPENVVASTDCGLGARCHPQIAWAKLGALVRGAQLASKTLFR